MNLIRGVARNFLERGLKSLKILDYGTAKTVNFEPFSMRFQAL